MGNDVTKIVSKEGILWRPDPKKKTKLDDFRNNVNKQLGLSLDNYHQLYQWSVDHYADFWSCWWHYGQFKSSSPPLISVDASASTTDIPRWFPGAKLNFAENLLQFRDDRIALYATGEGQGEIHKCTYEQLFIQSCKYARALKGFGVEMGDRVVGYLPNFMPTIEAMLGVATLGAVWSGTSPDFGVTGVLERFAQIDPMVLFSVEAVIYNGKIHDHLEKVSQVVLGLKNLRAVVIIPFVRNKEDIDISNIQNSIFLDDFLSRHESDEVVEFTQVPFHHPLFIMFSSGTTGVPKCMVHSVGGTLIQNAKEHQLHCNITRDDIVTYYTTSGWMMWNWLVVGLFSGCSLVLYDGSPLLPTPNILWDLVDELGITVLGTGAKWLAVLEEKGIKPKATHHLTSLRAILSTGSPLSPHSFDYVYEHIKTDLMLGSIAGGTDIISCFMGCNPTLPVYRGEIQSRNLGMAVQSWDEEGCPITDRSGELVCVKPFPSMPTHFWNDADGKKYRKAYFNRFPEVWTHGDYCNISSSTGGVVMLGRSDGTLNPNGVRFGSAEIYNLVEQFNEFEDSVCVAQRKKITGEERVVLFLKMKHSHELTEELIRRLTGVIRQQLSARHVPSVILPIAGIPYTVNGKKVEVAVRQVIHGEEIENGSALADVQILQLFQNLPQMQGW